MAVENQADAEPGGFAMPPAPSMGHISWLRPFDELEVGDQFRSRSRTITETDVVQFAGLTGDWHPAHTDATWAGNNIFGRRVAHGMLCVCYAIGLVPNEYVMALRRIKNL